MKTVWILLVSLALPSPFALAVIGGGDVTMEVPNEGNVVFSHEVHVWDAELSCKRCHDKTYLDVSQHRKASASQMEKGQSCGACHNGKEAFGVSVKKHCNDCHKK